MYLTSACAILAISLEDDCVDQKSCLIGTFDKKIGLLHSTIVARLADKLAKLIVHAKHGWLINWPRGYQPSKEKTYVYLY